MVHELAHADREGSNGSRHEQVGSAGRLRSSLQNSPVHRSHLVGVVGEVGCRAGIVEREHSANEQRALVVAGREGTAESRTRLAVAHVGVGEEHRCRCREAVAELACLAHEAVLYLHAVDDA